MDEQNIPIDINNNKLLDWLVSRRHVTKDWQNSILQVREKINNAIQDMPAHEGIIKLLSGQHINYFHCLKIIEILKETEADSKNLFGRYGSQRMKDWQQIVSMYQKDNIYLAEAAQILIRNVSYEIPSLKKQVAKLEQSQTDAEKKIKDYSKNEALALKEFNTSCEQLGITGKNIKSELIQLLGELPKIYENAAGKIKLVKPAIELYLAFNQYLSGKDTGVEVLPLLRFVAEKGNPTTYEYTYGEKPLKIELEEDTLEKNSESEEQIDFGDNEIDFGENPDFELEESKIDWGTPSTDEEFEIVEHTDVDLSLEESGIVVEKSGMDGGVARGSEALTVLDNPKMRDQVINELLELDSFLKMRLFELSNDSDILAMSQMQNAPTMLQMQTVESITSMSDCVNVALAELMNKRTLHLHNIKHSPKYVDILTANLKQKLTLTERMRQSIGVLKEQIEKYQSEIKNFEPAIRLLIEKTKQLQKEVQQDISKRYKGRVVNIVGGVNML
ncbi:CDK5 regulatory subunit-associated protein 3 [Tribolium castaneum]|uniref:CDK5RAP3-like protein n=1 Tax=Tribolium castaneum TaxID=7070 RepID=D6WFV3_TRICA|nr:PREDICTED: CDK5 regulatory subunit-associated protein 3 [Tribolium castaneum]EFA00941.1 CDK5RAP3-like protein [Tribolium castaneum]|eukprot:XP_968122.1 PREDICTED: CDK5 regulatory subunit-associated protein 3 [Tribolium castaneum]